MSKYQLQRWIDTGQIRLPEDVVSLVFRGDVGPTALLPGQVLTLDLDQKLVPASPTSGDVIGVKFDGASLPGQETRYMPQGPVQVEDWTDVTGEPDLAPNQPYFLWPGGLLRPVPPSEEYWIIKVGNAISERVLSVILTPRVAP